MKQLHAAAFCLCVLAALSAVLRAQGTPAALTPQQLAAHTRVVMAFYRPGITPEERLALIHRDYQQHNQTYVKYAKDKKVSNWQAFAEIRRQQGVDQGSRAASSRRTAPIGLR